uniref:Uncharacterized protein n=1 Tax=Tanacetum cinerariifolium TaxID=118510 RepID=A0A6L2NK17_TANCI|nr:hypothetical protein [Tanacetum cinerariifolium]GEX05645.1 hypothetical protein [Tanacetum cinerariifolium]
MMLLAHAITQRYFTPINNRLYTSSNTRNQAVVQANRVNIQSQNVRNSGRSARSHIILKRSLLRVLMFKKRLRMYREIYELLCQEMLQMFSATIVMLKSTMHGIVQSQEFEILKIEELSVTICMMARIQQANTDSNEGTSYDSAFISEVQIPSTSFMNMLFSKSDHEQTYHEQPKIINSTNGDDQINSDIIFDDPNVEVNDGNIEHDKNAHDQHDNELELLARNAYKEVKKVKQHNVVLTKQLEQ